MQSESERGARLPVGTPSAVGSFPGTDIWETVAVVAGELPDLPVLPELPNRGPGSDMIGRTMAMVADVSSDLAVSTTATGWRIAGSLSSPSSSQTRRSLAWLGEDLDAIESRFADYSGAFKIAMAGPWTLAAAVELRNGERVLRDQGAVVELQSALAQAAAEYANDVATRLPGAQIMLQFDEPLLPAVLAGALPTQSGFAAHRAQEAPVVTKALQRVGALTPTAVDVGFHCCADHVPLRVFREAKASFISVDMIAMADLAGRMRDAYDQELGEILDSSAVLIAGILDVTAVGVDRGRANADRQRPDLGALLRPLTTVLHRLGIPAPDLESQLVLTSTCGLVGAGDLTRARSVLAELAAAGRALRDERVDFGS